MEKIQSHEVKDVYRVREGVLVEIHKYKHMGNYYFYEKRKEKRVRGCKGLTILTEYFVSNYGGSTVHLPKGTYFFSSMPIEVVTDPKEFRAEIKSSGGSIPGSITELKAVLRDVEDILNSYRSMEEILNDVKE